MKQRANELDGKQWLKNSISVWSDIRKTAEEKRLDHPASFPVFLAERLIESYSIGKEQVVLDPFAGIGSTLVAAHTLGRDSVGVELSPEYVRIARRRLVANIPFAGVARSDVIHGDSTRLYDHVGLKSCDMCITSPPYWNVLQRKRTADGREQRDYGQHIGDLGLVEGYKSFLGALNLVFSQVYGCLKDNSYCCVVVRDLGKKGKFYPLHMDFRNVMERLDFELKTVIVWDKRADYNSLRPLGYPSVFYVNTVHEYIMVFKK